MSEPFSSHTPDQDPEVAAADAEALASAPEIDLVEPDSTAALDRQLRAFRSSLDRDPSLPQKAMGPDLWIGFDAEWVFDEATQSNTILSIQLFVPDQPALTRNPAKKR